MAAYSSYAMEASISGLEAWIQNEFVGAEIQHMERHCGQTRVTLLCNALDDAIMNDFDDLGYEMVSCKPTHSGRLKVDVVPK